MTVLIVAAAVAWVAAGVAGFTFWWTTDWDLAVEQVWLAVFCGTIMGPFAWLIGWWIHRGPHRPGPDITTRGRVLMSKRR